MSDQELLELAAKAMGSDFGELNGRFVEVRNGEVWAEWNPLEDDGDALRLAVQCGMEVSFVDDEPDREGRDTRACVGYVVQGDPRVRYVFEDHRGDIFAATRRAIVRAAAEIGKGDEMTDREVMQMALEALEELIDCGAEAWGDHRPCVRQGMDALANLRKALAQPSSKTCDECGADSDIDGVGIYCPACAEQKIERRPLTDEQIKASAMDAFNCKWDADDETLINKYGHGVYLWRFIDFARAVEAAHGIKGEA